MASSAVATGEVAIVLMQVWFSYAYVSIVTPQIREKVVFFFLSFSSTKKGRGLGLLAR